VHGGVAKNGSPTFSPAPVTKAPSVADPLAALPVPSTTGLTNYGSQNLSGASKATIKPGIYSQIIVSGSASLTLGGGLYIIEGGGFQVSGSARVTGTGVTVYNAGSKFPNSGGSFGAISLSGSGTISLSPATTGPYAGVLFAQPAANTEPLSVSGAAIAGVTGMIYAPAAQLVASGSAQVSASFVVNTLTLSGSAVLNGGSANAMIATVTGTLTQSQPKIELTALASGAAGTNFARPHFPRHRALVHRSTAFGSSAPNQLVRDQVAVKKTATTRSDATLGRKPGRSSPNHERGVTHRPPESDILPLATTTSRSPSSTSQQSDRMIEELLDDLVAGLLSVPAQTAQSTTVGPERVSIVFTPTRNVKADDGGRG
jgi:hypothetical protein